MKWCNFLGPVRRKNWPPVLQQLSYVSNSEFRWCRILVFLKRNIGSIRPQGQLSLKCLYCIYGRRRTRHPCWTGKMIDVVGAEAVRKQNKSKMMTETTTLRRNRATNTSKRNKSNNAIQRIWCCCRCCYHSPFRLVKSDCTNDPSYQSPMSTFGEFTWRKGYR